MRTRGIQKGEGGRKSRAYFSPGGAGVESTAPNFQRPLRKRVADMKHGFESRWGHQLNHGHFDQTGFHPPLVGAPVHLPGIVGGHVVASNSHTTLARRWSVHMGTGRKQWNQS